MQSNTNISSNIENMSVSDQMMLLINYWLGNSYRLGINILHLHNKSISNLHLSITDLSEISQPKLEKHRINDSSDTILLHKLIFFRLFPPI